MRHQQKQLDTKHKCSTKTRHGLWKLTHSLISFRISSNFHKLRIYTEPGSTELWRKHTTVRRKTIGNRFEKLKCSYLRNFITFYIRWNCDFSICRLSRKTVQKLFDTTIGDLTDDCLAPLKSIDAVIIWFNKTEKSLIKNDPESSVHTVNQVDTLKYSIR